jgi:hypothetical protein
MPFHTTCYPTPAINPLFAPASITFFDTLPCKSLSGLLKTQIGKQCDTLPVQRILLAADCTYAFLSFEFLQGYGYVKREVNESYWFTLPLARQCELEKHHTAGYTCGYRANFFQKLLQELGFTQYFNASVPDKHTYTIVNAGNPTTPYWIVADAYDPFVVLDTTGRAIDIFSLLQNVQGAIFRTKRNFGPTKALVKDSLLQHTPGITNAQKLTNKLQQVNQQLLNQNSRTLGEYFGVSLDTIFESSSITDYPFYLHQYGRSDTFNLQHLFSKNSYYFTSNVVTEVPIPLKSDTIVVKAAERFVQLCRKLR